MKIWYWFIPGVLLIGCLAFLMIQKNRTTETRAIPIQVNLADLDGDGDNDALVMNGGHANLLWINQGGLQGSTQGKFSASLQRLGGADTNTAAIGDLDGDHDLDILMGASGGFEIYLNSGGPQGGWNGNFQFQQRVSLAADPQGKWSPALGDLDGDGDLDLVLNNCCSVSTRLAIWINDGSAGFSQAGFAEAGLAEAGQNNEVTQAMQAILGDLDGDQDLDLWISSIQSDRKNADHSDPQAYDQVWFNDGHGQYSAGGQLLQASQAAALGDLDGDGDLDAITMDRSGLNVWINDGSGHFDLHLRKADRSAGGTITLADLDEDGDLDVLFSSGNRAEAWFNDGAGNLALSAQRVDLPGQAATALGDLDGDGDLDLFCGYQEKNYRIWWNDGYGRLGLSWR